MFRLKTFGVRHIYAYFAITCLVFSGPLSFADHEVGNGGGGICYSGKCMTLAEAGLRLETPSDPYMILPPKTVQALKALTAKV